jgi:hypothetical protein
VLASTIAELEGAAAGVITATGMAAVSVTLNLLRAGDLVIAAHDGYGGTYRLLRALAKKQAFDVAFVDLTSERPGSGRHRVEGPWPGALPAPSPAWVHHDPVPAELVDGEDEPVTVSGRGVLSAAPARLSVDGDPWLEVVAWAGPWPLEERWWDTARRRRRSQAPARK